MLRSSPVPGLHLRAILTRSVLLVSALSLTAACEASSPLGRRSGAIVAGQADPGHPAVGFLASSTATMHCSGTLIAPTRVLTAAHCLRPPALDFVLGTRRYSAKAKLVHPHYDPDKAGHEPFTFDLGIVILAEPVLDVRPAILAAASPRVGEVVTIVGYGLTQAGAGDPGTKRRAQTTITRVTSQNFWIGAGHKTPPTTCNGDSGGPTFVRRDGVEVLLGVHSATEDAPVSCLGVGFDVRVDVFAAWIAAETARTNLPAGDPCAPLGSRHLCMPEGGCALAPGLPDESSSLPMMLVLLWGLFVLRRVTRRC